MRIIQSTVAACTCRRYLVCMRYSVPIFEQHTHTHIYTKQFENQVGHFHSVQIACDESARRDEHSETSKHTEKASSCFAFQSFTTSCIVNGNSFGRLAEAPVSTVFICGIFWQTYLVLSGWFVVRVCLYHIRAHSFQIIIRSTGSIQCTAMHGRGGGGGDGDGTVRGRISFSKFLSFIIIIIIAIQTHRTTDSSVDGFCRWNNVVRSLTRARARACVCDKIMLVLGVCNCLLNM